MEYKTSTTKFKPQPMRGHNNYDTAEATDATVIKEWGPSLTIQSQAEDADLNVIMERFGLTGKMPENPRIPQYGDFTQVMNYRTALEAVRNAHEGFMEIPAKIRARFDNDPQQLLDFVHNDANIEEAQSLGLLKPKKVIENAPNGTTDQTPPGATQTTGGIPSGNPSPTGSSGTGGAGAPPPKTK